MQQAGRGVDESVSEKLAFAAADVCPFAAADVCPFIAHTSHLASLMTCNISRNPATAELTHKLKIRVDQDCQMATNLRAF